ncbi:flavodoxin FldB [Pseudomaricurvus sp. HS19]|uniref:flavodoxin FldB n=1 Tax=Pseudomaricurvus sp. HS19 TaxID=2692626 RepID=UPI0013682956|nr:flavodoxin FldB [Pseudomaricurvus sp. HS19]MYM61976.1 flavodoxin FldB [Pseudomaricurvus sp. HS19]
MSHAPIGLFYGSSTCYTEMVADKIRERLGSELVDVHNIANDPISNIQFYQHLILGIPTWDYGELQEDWEEIWDEIDELDWQGRTIAIYGLGDQEGYPEWFLDAMGYLHHKLVNLGARAVGYWPNEGFEFEQSKALTGDETQFVGLALDEETQFDLTDERLDQWCLQILREFGLTDG